MNDKDTKTELMGFVWNMLASCAAAFSSVIVLLVITRALGVETAAIFSIAVAVSTVLMNLGLFNVIGYQVTDIKEKYDFSIYLRLRQFTVGAMIAIGLGHILVSDYDQYKAAVILSYCIYKAVNVYCDVYQGRYQQKGRMDIASRLNFFKVAIPDFLLCVIAGSAKNLLLAIQIATVAEISYVIAFNVMNFKSFKTERPEKDLKKVLELAITCLPLFFGAFSSAYVLNSSKYAIDRNMNGEFQTYYSILLLPATTVHMFAGFIYRPLLTKFACLWLEDKFAELKRITTRIMLFIIIMGIAVCAVGTPVGIPLLALIYGVPEIKAYSFPFLLLLMAGTLNALNVLLCYLLTMMRLQKSLYAIYGGAFLASLIIPWLWVQRFGMAGAACSFLSLMILQLISSIIVFFGSLNKGRKRLDK